MYWRSTYGAAQRSPESQSSNRILKQEPHILERDRLILKLKRVPKVKLEIPEPKALLK